MPPKISVIIPTYNSAKTLQRTLYSVFKQTLTPHEIIVVDDGSWDDTIEILKSYGSKIKFICQGNSGASAARNKGASLATGDVIAFLDSDDIWHNRKLEMQAEVFDKDKSVGICTTAYGVCTAYDDIDAEEFTDSEMPKMKYREIKFAQVFTSPYLLPSSTAVRKNIFDHLGGFDETLETAEDIDLFLRLCFVTRYIFVENTLCYYIRQEGSLSTSAKKSPFESHLDVIEKFCFLEKSFTKANRNRIGVVKSSIYTNWGSAELSQGRFGNAASKLSRAIKIRPSLRAVYLLIKSIYFSLKRK